MAVGGAVGGAVGAVHLGGVAGHVLGGAAGALAGAATRSLLDGSDFGDNVLAALPDVIGSTIGELVAGAIAGPDEPERIASSRGCVQFAQNGATPRTPGQAEVRSDTEPSMAEDIIVTARHWWERAWDKLENLFSGGVTAIENNSYVQGIASHVMAAVNRAGSYYAQAATGETQSYDMRPAVAALAQTYNRVMTAPLSRDYGAITPPMSLFDYSPPQPQVVKWHLTGSGIAAGTLEAASVVGAVKAGSLARAGLGAAETELLTGVRTNQLAGSSREALARAELEAQYPGASIQNEVYLRSANGKRAIDPLSGEARRIDSVVIQDGRVVDSVEVTSMTANKDVQTLKEMSIRNNGGSFIRDRATGQLLDISTVPTRIVRKP